MGILGCDGWTGLGVGTGDGLGKRGFLRRRRMNDLQARHRITTYMIANGRRGLATEEVRDQVTTHRVLYLQDSSEDEVDSESTQDRSTANDNRKERIKWPASSQKKEWHMYEEEKSREQQEESKGEVKEAVQLHSLPFLFTKKLIGDKLQDSSGQWF
ncbi:hypothetical protein DPMN_009253 [Dreissena polymorpha]|uniref:Uncharacterized protein n=1 Tax=Dreissena polymorpha TaxID=45954 RepID=A0A9D4MXQ6_DREPO|nr:hypothetical protein DPMN_009253 [Dreissena polymorpha]